MNGNKQSRQRTNSFLKSNKYIIRVLILGLILFSIYLFHDTLSPDEALYAWNSYQLSEEPSLLFSNYLWQHQPPLIYMIISFFDIFMPNIIAARLVIYLFGLLGIYAIYLLGKELRSNELGLISALFLLINPWYWMMTNRILLDVPLTVFFMFSMLYLIKYYRTDNSRYLLFSSLFMLCTLLTKYVGIMLLPIFVVALIFIVIIKHKNARNSIFIIIILLLISIFIKYDLILKRLNAISISNFIGNFPSLFISLFNLLLGYTPSFVVSLLTVLSIIFLFILIYMFVKSKFKEAYLFLIVWILFVSLFRIFFSGIIQVRYLLPLLPALILLITYSLFDVIILLYQKFNILMNKKCFIIVISVLFFGLLIMGNKINYMASYNKVGFDDAGEWIKDNVDNQSVIYAGSLKQIRYYSGKEFTAYNGQIYSSGTNYWNGIVRKPSSIELNESTYLVIDFREKFQPEWIYQVNLTKAKVISSLNYTLQKVVYKDMPFFVMPPNTDRNEFLEYFNVTPYEIVSNKSNVYISGAGEYTYNFDDGKYIESIGFEKADSIMDYAEFLFRRQSYLRQPVVLIFKRDPIS